MKVVTMVAGHACVRVQKMALPLLEKGYKVHLVTNKIPSFSEYYSSVTLYQDVGQLLESLSIYAKHTDIFHVHNEPSYFVTMIKEVSDIPVILDVHDSNLARVTPENDDSGETVVRRLNEERNNFQIADGLVFPSATFRDIIVRDYELDQPSLVLPSYLPKRMYRYDHRVWLGGIVYEGRVDLKEEIKGSKNLSGFEYCDYEDFALKAREVGLPFHIYSPNTSDKFVEKFKDICFLHPPENLPDLIKRLSSHEWGLVGNIFPTPEWEVAFPNKLFEYIAACVPVVSINADYCSDFLLKHKVGIVVDSLEELRDRWDEHRECRKNLIKLRQSFSMDSHIHELEALYEKF